jgi:hypothetical protein
VRIHERDGIGVDVAKQEKMGWTIIQHDACATLTKNKWMMLRLERGNNRRRWLSEEMNKRMMK